MIRESQLVGDQLGPSAIHAMRGPEVIAARAMAPNDLPKASQVST